MVTCAVPRSVPLSGVPVYQFTVTVAGARPRFRMVACPVVVLPTAAESWNGKNSPLENVSSGSTATLLEPTPGAIGTPTGTSVTTDAAAAPLGTESAKSTSRFPFESTATLGVCVRSVVEVRRVGTDHGRDGLAA